MRCGTGMGANVVQKFGHMIAIFALQQGGLIKDLPEQRGRALVDHSYFNHGIWKAGKN